MTARSPPAARTPSCALPSPSAPPHLGDLDDELSYRAFRTDLELYLRMLDVTPEAVACDLHPEYRATKWAQEQGLPLVEIQHHHAHAAACLAGHGETRGGRAG